MSEDILTITIDGREEGIDAIDFVGIVRETIALLKDIETAETGEAAARWVVTTASKNSPLKLALRADGGTHSHAIADRLLVSLRALDDGAVRPSIFSDTMLDRAKRIVRPVGARVSNLVFSTPNRGSLGLSQKIALGADRFRLPEEYTEYGEIEGTLDQINVHKPPFKFCVYDFLTDRPIPCAFAAEDFDQIKGLLRTRVRVNGLITFRRKDDQPQRVQVEDWVSLISSHDTPSIEDLHALKLNLTGGRSSEDVIADLRGMYE